MDASMHSLDPILNLTVCTASQPAQSFWHSQIPIVLRLAIFHLPSDLCTSTSSSFLMRPSAAYTGLAGSTPACSHADRNEWRQQRQPFDSAACVPIQCMEQIQEPLITYGAQITHSSPHNVPFRSACMGRLHRTLTTPKA